MGLFSASYGFVQRRLSETEDLETDPIECAVIPVAFSTAGEKGRRVLVFFKLFESVL